jgi:hypothetical protein
MEDPVDLVCNSIHIACLFVLKLEKLDHYRNDAEFIQTSTGFRSLADSLMTAVREKEKMEKP